MDERSGEKDRLSGGNTPTVGSRELEGAFALLAEMTRSFAESMDLEATLARALGSITEHLNAEAGSLWLLDPDQSELECRASVGPNPITGMVLPISKGVIGRCVRENICQHVFDAKTDPA